MSRKGENIYKRKDGRWEGRYMKGHINGKIKYGYVYAKTYKEVKEKLKLLSVISAEEAVSPAEKALSNISFGIVSLAWLEALKPRLKKSSIVKYTNILKIHLFPYIKNRDIGSITQDEIIGFSNELLHSGGRKGDGLSPKTIMSIISVLKRIFEYAEQYEKLTVIELNKFSIKQPQKEMRVLSLIEQQKLCKHLCENLTLTNLGILICLYTGIRIGEICALKWEDIFFDEQYLYVHRTMQRIQNVDNEHTRTSIMISAPKSESSVRKIPLPDEIFQYIVATKRPGNTYFLTGSSRTYVEPRTLQNRFKAILRICGIEDINFHVLRHTFATRCVELGFDAKSLSEILGHASVNITLNRYVHPSMELKQKNMNMLSDLFAVK